ncbi:pyridoxamine 5'-phosphate oxidase family protein [Rhabdothermincola salaria]|uniref:pyridoxamine 5'-phosphate oxidase family protein n=1 Tax=Rhabdothermincola salaria TaxID=2903142 RepID=UPI001E290CA1|nr:pyridoxamine 5'-phosphate oxidase family protein [Rhabdothermincola salaria]MCD9625382.1 pyridoxamine 5'-phosphate oxidase family protein [Rhabdothermincola salaria]
MELDRNGLEVLGREDCLALLRTVPVGRLGLSMNALPVVLPVSFVVDRERLVVRTARGTKLDAALAGAVVAFEADDYDARTGDAWSVLVRGSTAVLGEPPEQPPPVGDRALWVGDTADQWVTISTELVSGRRFWRQPGHGDGRGAHQSMPAVTATGPT